VAQKSERTAAGTLLAASLPPPVPRNYSSEASAPAAGLSRTQKSWRSVDRIHYL